MACNQTAVAVLQELCVKRKWNPPQYEETYSGGTPNEPTFHISVTICNGIQATGVGRQKKAAKHDAAKKALELLSLRALTDGEEKPVQKSGPSSPMNPHEDYLGGNAVGELSETCINHHLPQPNFTLIGDEGEPHQKLFTYRCTVSSFQETGTARKKQNAKHLAAVAMLKLLKNNFQNILTLGGQNEPKTESKPHDVNAINLQAERDAKMVERYVQIKEDQLLIPSFDHGLKISDYHLAFKEKLSNFKEIMASPSVVKENDPTRKVALVAEALNHKTSSTLLQTEKGCVAFILLDTVPSAVQLGMHVNREEAFKLAATSLLMFLETMAT